MRDSRFAVSTCKSTLIAGLTHRKRKDFPMFCALRQVAAMLKTGEIIQEDYDNWRYHHPEFDATQKRAKVMSQGLSDMLVEGLKKDGE